MEGAVSVVLMEERSRDGREEQSPVYYISEAQVGAKLRYTELEKMAYAIVMASRMLKHYFTTHPITVTMSYLLHSIFENREAIERISKWVMEIDPFALSFVSHSDIKSQALADFIVD